MDFFRKELFCLFIHFCLLGFIDGASVSNKAKDGDRIKRAVISAAELKSTIDDRIQERNFKDGECFVKHGLGWRYSDTPSPGECVRCDKDPRCHENELCFSACAVQLKVLEMVENSSNERDRLVDVIIRMNSIQEKQEGLDVAPIGLVYFSLVAIFALVILFIALLVSNCWLWKRYRVKKEEMGRKYHNIPPQVEDA